MPLRQGRELINEYLKPKKFQKSQNFRNSCRGTKAKLFEFPLGEFLSSNKNKFSKIVNFWKIPIVKPKQNPPNPKISENSYRGTKAKESTISEMHNVV